MRRARLQTGNRKRATGNRTPLDEGIIPLDKRWGRSWTSMSDEALVSYAKRFMKEKGINRRWKLHKVDRGLCEALRRRGLLNETGLSSMNSEHRDWASMSDEKLLRYAIRFIRQEGIKSRSGFQEVDASLYTTLLRRGLHKRVTLEADKRNWRAYGDEQFARHAQRIVDKKELSSIKELRTLDESLYCNLLKRGLLNTIIFHDQMRRWLLLPDEDLLKHAKTFMKENGINYVTKLMRAERSLFNALRRRNLLGELGFQKKQKRRPWSSMSDNEIISTANEKIIEGRISSWGEMRQKDSGLYAIICQKKLQSKIPLPPPKPHSWKGKKEIRNWHSMSDEELVSHAKRLVDENGIKSINELKQLDHGLYNALRRRKLRRHLEFEKGRVGWSSWSDEEIIEYARKIIEEEGIDSPSEFQRKHNALYLAIRRRKLYSKLDLKRRIRDFTSPSDEELLDLAKEKISENGITKRSEFQKLDGPFYAALSNRGLLGKLDFHELKRDWKSMTDEEVIEIAERIIKEKNIRKSSQMCRVDGGLYYALRTRNLLGRLGFASTKRKKGALSSLSDDELLELARKIIREKSLKTLKELREADTGLHTALLKRKLLENLNLIKARKIKWKWSLMSDEEIIIFAKKLMKEKGIFYRRSLALSNPGLYDALRRRKLLEKLGLRRRIKKMRSWASMSDEELVDLARKRIEENGISTRREFRNIDKGLHEALRLRKLLDRVFADVEQSKQQAFRKQLLLGLSQAADAMQQFGEQR